MAQIKVTRRTAIAGLGATAVGLVQSRGPATASDVQQRVLLVPGVPSLASHDFITVGIGATGELLTNGDFPDLWLGCAYFATAPIDAWRIPGAIPVDEAFAATDTRRGKPLTLITGDLAHPRWIEVAVEVATAAKRAGRHVVAANAWIADGALGFDELVRRLAPTCDSLEADPELPAEFTNGMDHYEQAILVVATIEAIAGAVAKHGARMLAARLKPGLFRAGGQRFLWPAGCRSTPPEIAAACSMHAPAPAIQVLQVPSVMPAWVDRHLARLARELPNRRETLTVIGHHAGIADRGRPFDVFLRQITPVG